MTRLIFLWLALPILLPAQGKVYLVIGSDTGIWDGMDVAKYRCTYNISLFSDPTRNTARVMDPEFRMSLRDPFGTPMKLTWWMMAGNIFRHATNTNVPYASTMPIYLMRRYHGEALERWGDEVSLHYHTFVWTDEDGDGRSYWNQARTFDQTSEDFDATLADILLDEGVFPVSFRSGWHAMDNDWQRRLNEVLPYSLHNDWPARRVDVTEPLDNIYDWSRAPSSFVPYHPSPSDYQVPGDGSGWNVRSEYLSQADSAFMDRIFAQAALGIDQVVCLWAHLPEADFPDNLRKVHTSATAALPRYPGVTFRYCTAVEAMHRWRGGADTLGPAITVEEIASGDSIRWRIRSDEPLFQPVPFVAGKTRYGEREMLACVPTGERTWETVAGRRREDLVAVGVAATDTSGNLTTTIVRYLPDDLYVDNEDPGYAELRGAWTMSSIAAWGRTARVTSVPAGDSAAATWTCTVPAVGRYLVRVLTPGIAAPGGRVVVTVTDGSQVIGSREFPGGIEAGRWAFVTAVDVATSTNLSVSMTIQASATASAQASADVVQVSASVRDKWVVIPELSDLGEVITGAPTTLHMTVRNEGLLPVTITGVDSRRGLTAVQTNLPVAIPPMGETNLAFIVTAGTAGNLLDTLIVRSDDPRHAAVSSVLRGRAVEYFAIVDNGDPSGYTEAGSWSNSVAQAFGGTSRYAYPAPGVSASFEAVLTKGGRYRILSIVPTTVNASNRARYRLSLDDVVVDSAFIDQNAGSGSWVQILEHVVHAGARARVVLTDAMDPVISNRVLRADALRFQWVDDASTVVAIDGSNEPAETLLGANYPNPFNPSTTIRFSLPQSGWVSLKVVDMLGRDVATLFEGTQSAGTHTAVWNAANVPSGVYFCRLAFDGKVSVRSMQLVR